MADDFSLHGGPDAPDDTTTEAWVAELPKEDDHSRMTPMAGVIAARDIANAAHQGNSTARRLSIALLVVFVVPSLVGMVWGIFSLATG